MAESIGRWVKKEFGYDGDEKIERRPIEERRWGKVEARRTKPGKGGEEGKTRAWKVGGGITNRGETGAKKGRKEEGGWPRNQEGGKRS